LGSGVAELGLLPEVARYELEELSSKALLAPVGSATVP
jgi:hypothetical protein